MKKKLGDDPRLINDGSLRAHNKIKWQMRGAILLVVLSLAAIIALILLSSCAAPNRQFKWGPTGGTKIEAMKYFITADNGIYPDIEHSPRVRLLTTDTIFPPIFEFSTVSQFLVFSDTIEEYHMNQRVVGIKGRITLVSAEESAQPASFPIDVWKAVNDSTIIGFSSHCRAEWQTRFGEQAVRVDFIDPVRGPAYYIAFEYWRDTSLVR